MGIDSMEYRYWSKHALPNNFQWKSFQVMRDQLTRLAKFGLTLANYSCMKEPHKNNLGNTLPFSKAKVCESRKQGCIRKWGGIFWD